ncbi:hypothetical protein SASPL_116292 [Salvia splendens]|uniref:Uncharacterized protein n=1 Tax=Salvia splendens TaxID=180675 RepID=A0A8X8XX72_SALSN|nr:hypothetical protein SASPL_116292 [Salvia splendens]
MGFMARRVVGTASGWFHRAANTSRSRPWKDNGLEAKDERRRASRLAGLTNETEFEGSSLLEDPGGRDPPGCAEGAPAGPGTVWFSTTWTWSFIPPRQCSLLPQMKYRSPGLVKANVVFPLLIDCSTLVVLHPL